MNDRVSSRRALCAALAFAGCGMAGADVRYTFDSVFGAFTLVTKALLAKEASFPASRLANSRGFLRAKVTSVAFRAGQAGSDTLTLFQGKDRYTFVFKPGAFGAVGSRKTYVGIEGALRVEKVAGKG